MWKNAQDYIKAMPAWKKFLWFAAVAAGTLLMLTFLIWAFSQHGTIGLFWYNGTYRTYFSIVICITVALPVLAILDIYLASRKPAGKIRLPSKYIWVIAVIAIIIPSALMIWLVPQTSKYAGDKAVQLIMADGAGKIGIPNLAVTFWTLNPTQNTLRWGDSSINNIAKEDKPSQQHAFMLRDLQPATEYWYSLNDAKPVQFVTMPGKGQPLHFAVGSDAHFGAKTARNDLTLKMLQQISDPAHNYRMLFSLGDLVDWGFSDAQWQTAIQALAPITSAMPAWFVMGNHEALFGGMKFYEDYMSPQPMEVQTGSRLWQRIDVDNVHFLLLDLDWDTVSYTKEQAAWLEQQLATIPTGDWKIVMSHSFYYSSGGYWEGSNCDDLKDMIATLTPLFEKYHVNLVFSGHNHLLELLQKNNVTYAICGAFGGLPSPERSYVSTPSIWYMAGQYAFMDVTVSQDTAILVFRDPDYKELKTLTVSR